MLHDYPGTGISHLLQGISAWAAWAPNFERVEHPSVPLWPSQKSPGTLWETLPEISTSLKKTTKQQEQQDDSLHAKPARVPVKYAHLPLPMTGSNDLLCRSVSSTKGKKNADIIFFAADARPP